MAWRPYENLIDGELDCGEVVPVMHPYHAVSERVNPPRLDTAVLVLHGHFLPPFSRAGDADSNFFPKFSRRNRRLVPIAVFAVRPGGYDRMERNHPEAVGG